MSVISCYGCGVTVGYGELTLEIYCSTCARLNEVERMEGVREVFVIKEKPPLVILKTEELNKAALEGVRRRIYNSEKGYKDNFPGDSYRWERDINGAIGELVIYKWLGLEWDGRGYDYLAEDFPGGVQIKFSNTGFLNIPANSSLDKIFILVKNGKNLFSYEICGYIAGADALRVGEAKERPENGYKYLAVPEKNLKNPHDLLRLKK